MIQANNEQRVRAWMIIQGKFSASASELVIALDGQRKDEYVIVRADLVESLEDEKPGMVVPIDAREGESSKYEYLYEIRDMIVERLGLEPDDYQLLEVDSDGQEKPPHTSSGYITRGEAHAAIDLNENGGKPGRQDQSPGFNPWG
jgi:hypothetical protein